MFRISIEERFIESFQHTVLLLLRTQLMQPMDAAIAGGHEIGMHHATLMSLAGEFDEFILSLLPSCITQQLPEW